MTFSATHVRSASSGSSSTTAATGTNAKRAISDSSGTASSMTAKVAATGLPSESSPPAKPFWLLGTSSAMIANSGASTALIAACASATAISNCAGVRASANAG